MPTPVCEVDLPPFSTGVLRLDTIDLPDNMTWQDKHQWLPVAQTVRRTVAGNVVTFAQGLTRGRPITLVANQSQGWLTLDQVTALQALASTVGATYSLMIEADVFIVQFRHEDFPAIEVEPLIPRLNEASTDFYSGTIKLLTV